MNEGKIAPPTPTQIGAHDVCADKMHIKEFWPNQLEAPLKWAWAPWVCEILLYISTTFSYVWQTKTLKAHFHVYTIPTYLWKKNYLNNYKLNLGIEHNHANSELTHKLYNFFSSTFGH